MGMADELLKLQQLHQSGALTDEEFAQAKAALLVSAQQQPQPTREIAEQLEEIRRQQEVDRIDRQWQEEREKYQVTGRTEGGNGYPYRQVPSKIGSVFGGVGAVVIGVVWMSLAGGPGGGGFAAFGLVFIAVGIGIAVYSYTVATGYEDAEARYQKRRRKALRGEKDEEDSPLNFG